MKLFPKMLSKVLKNRIIQLALVFVAFIFLGVFSKVDSLSSIKALIQGEQNNETYNNQDANSNSLSNSVVNNEDTMSFADRESYNKEVVIHQGFADLLEYVMPAVVSVTAIKVIQPNLEQAPVTNNPLLDSFLKNFNIGPRETTSLGSGFILNKEGIIVTNNHVIEGAKEVKIVLSNEQTLDAQILATDKMSDLAVLKVEPNGQDLPTLNLGDSSKMRVGDWIIAIGNPFGLGGSASTGIISAIGRNISIGPYNEFIQTDASINRGNSGGPMINLKGEVVGINTAIASPTGGSVGIGFAIPSNSVKDIILQLLENGSVKRSWLGVQIQDLDEGVANYFGLDKNAKGVIITNVIEGSPASKANLKPGDIILSINGELASSYGKVFSKVANLRPQSVVKLEVLGLADKEKREVEIVLSERPEEKEAVEETQAKKVEDSLRHDFKEFGISVVEFDKELREKYKIEGDENVLVIDKVEAKLMKEKGIVSGMMILEVNKQKVNTILQMQDALNKSQDNQALILLKAPNGSRVYMTLNKK